VSVIRKYAAGSAQLDHPSANVTCAITASRISEASPAPQVMVLFDDLSLSLPETCPPRMAAAPEAIKNGPRPESSPSPRAADSDTKNAGDRAETSSSERTMTKFRNGAS